MQNIQPTLINLYKLNVNIQKYPLQLVSSNPMFLH